MEQIIRTGAVTRGYIGVEPQDITPELADAFRLPRREGAIITGVLRNSPAERAGVQVGDILVSVEGKPIANTAIMLNTISQLAPGTKARFRFLRHSREIEVLITVGRRPVPGQKRE
jgi:S1-C subfamily serine protease